MSAGCWRRHPRAAAAAAAYRTAPPRPRLTARAAPKQQQDSPAAAPNSEAPSSEAGDALLAAACGSMRRARAGTVPGGHRGLLAATALSPGDQIISLPRYSALCVPEHPPDCPAAHAAAAAALSAWQGAHGLALPAPLAAFLLDTGAEWEARLAAWLLWLVQRRHQRRRGGAVTATCLEGDTRGSQNSSSSGGSISASDAGDAKGCPPDLWDLYVDSLPAQHEMSTFYDFSEEEAETWLALSSWRDRAADYRKEALSLHQRYFAVPTSGSSSSSSGDGSGESSSSGSSSSGGTASLAALGLSDGPAMTAWAVGLVRSRTFGRNLEAPLSNDSGGSSSSSSSSSKGGQAEETPQQQQEEEEVVSLLMVPGADLVNHSFNENAAFQIAFPGAEGGHPGAQASPDVTRSGGSGDGPRLVIRALRAIETGEEVTISYGTDKRNATLLANYGFTLPGNPNDRIPLPPGTAPPPGAPRRPALSPSAGCPSPSSDDYSSSSSLRGSGGIKGSSRSEQLPPISPADLEASFPDVVASNPQLQRAAEWWRRRGALLSLGLEPCPQQQTSTSEPHISNEKQKQRQQQQPEAFGGLDELRVALAVCRQLDSHLTNFLRRHSQDSPERQTGAEAVGGSPRPVRLSAALAAAEEHALLARECAAVCEAELAAAGVAVA